MRNNFHTARRFWIIGILIKEILTFFIYPFSFLKRYGILNFCEVIYLSQNKRTSHARTPAKRKGARRGRGFAIFGTVFLSLIGFLLVFICLSPYISAVYSVMSILSGETTETTVDVSGVPDFKLENAQNQEEETPTSASPTTRFQKISSILHCLASMRVTSKTRAAIPTRL